jgi:hypothetical protein
MKCLSFREITHVLFERHLQIEITLFKRPEEATFLLLKNTLFAFIASLFRDQVDNI